MITIILNDQWTSFKSEYELVDIEINKSKVYVLVQNKLVRRNVYFLIIGNTNYPSFNNVVLSKRIADELDLNIKQPYVEVLEIISNSIFIAQKAKLF